VPVRLSVRRGPHDGVARAEVRRWCERMLAALDLAFSELSVVLTDDGEIHALNRDFRGKDKPTDVLAFALREGEGAEHAGELLGDVVVSVETARRQAARRGRPLDAELRMLLAHGLLHLVGWDHRTDAEDRAMKGRTRALMASAVDARPVVPRSKRAGAQKPRRVARIAAKTS